jgi:negative regulator of flagellin synthesis FlgM
MKIENTLKPVGTSPVGENQTRSSRADAHATKGASVGGEKVNLSPLSSQLKEAEASLKNVPVVDKARVEEIKQAISQGKFKVNAEVVADKLIDAAKELVNSRKA